MSIAGVSEPKTEGILKARREQLREKITAAKVYCEQNLHAEAAELLDKVLQSDAGKPIDKYDPENADAYALRADLILQDRKLPNSRGSDILDMAIYYRIAKRLFHFTGENWGDGRKIDEKLKKIQVSAYHQFYDEISYHKQMALGLDYGIIKFTDSYLNNFARKALTFAWKDSLIEANRYWRYLTTIAEKIFSKAPPIVSDSALDPKMVSLFLIGLSRNDWKSLYRLHKQIVLLDRGSLLSQPRSHPLKWLEWVISVLNKDPVCLENWLDLMLSTPELRPKIVGEMKESREEETELFAVYQEILEILRDFTGINEPAKNLCNRLLKIIAPAESVAEQWGFGLRYRG